MVGNDNHQNGSISMRSAWARGGQTYGAFVFPEEKKTLMTPVFEGRAKWSAESSAELRSAYMARASASVLAEIDSLLDEENNAFYERRSKKVSATSKRKKEEADARRQSNPNGKF
jgi:hypothetical protein